METTSKVFSTQSDLFEFMNMCGWKARKSGKELSFSEDYCIEQQEGNILTITLKRQKTELSEWVKTLGDIIEFDENQIVIQYHGKVYHISVIHDRKDTILKVNTITNTAEDIYFMSGLKTVCRKTAYCIGCHVCEANCPNGFIHMEKGRVKIDDRCVKCQKCHDVFHGCLVANSLRLPKGVAKMGSIDRYSNMGVEFDWVVDYFKKKDSFWEDNELGTNKIKYLKTFLDDAEITIKRKFSSFGSVVEKIGLNTVEAWGLILCNLVYTSEFNWWVLNTQIDHYYSQTEIVYMLGDKMSANSRSHVASAFKNIFISNPILGKTIGLGECDYQLKGKNRVLNTILRKSWSDPIPEVILYSLYKFAEACGEYYQFTLSILLDDTIERDGISPTRIFGLDRRTMVRIINGLSVNYPAFIIPKK